MPRAVRMASVSTAPSLFCGHAALVSQGLLQKELLRGTPGRVWAVPAVVDRYRIARPFSVACSWVYNIRDHRCREREANEVGISRSRRVAGFAKKFLLSCRWVPVGRGWRRSRACECGALCENETRRHVDWR